MLSQLLVHTGLKKFIQYLGYAQNTWTNTNCPYTWWFIQQNILNKARRWKSQQHHPSNIIQHHPTSSNINLLFVACWSCCMLFVVCCLCCLLFQHPQLWHPELLCWTALPRHVQGKTHLFLHLADAQRFSNGEAFNEDVRSPAWEYPMSSYFWAFWRWFWLESWVCMNLL